MHADTLKGLDFLTTTAMEDNDWDEVPILLIVTPEAPIIAPLFGGETIEMLERVGPAIKAQGVTGVTGLVLMNEGWGLSAHVSETKELLASMAQLRREGKGFADHPDAVEVKLFTAVDSEGVESRQFDRGSSVLRSAPSAGRLVDAVKALFEELTA